MPLPAAHFHFRPVMGSADVALRAVMTLADGSEVTFDLDARAAGNMLSAGLRLFARSESWASVGELERLCRQPVAEEA